MVRVAPTLEQAGLHSLPNLSHPGCPVVCSDIPALREVGGSAPIYVSPTHPGAVAEALARLLFHPVAARRPAVAASLERAAEFRGNWARQAKQLLQLTQHAL